MSARRRLTLATRRSELALWQARHVAKLLEDDAAGVSGDALEVGLLDLSTAGDRFLAGPLQQIGGKGLFVMEIEQALLDGRADIAVHSLKDLPSESPNGLVLGAIIEREDPRDAFVAGRAASFDAIPVGGRVGTSSLRRRAQVLALRPDLVVEPIRGNIQTRLKKVAELGLDGALLAMAGLKRMELLEGVEFLPPDRFVPAAGQGALAVQCRMDDDEVRERLARLDHPGTRLRVMAERAVQAGLEGGCSVPFAAHATLTGDRLHLDALLAEPDGTRILRTSRDVAPEDGERAGLEAARELLESGGAAILAALEEGAPAAASGAGPR